MKEPLHIGTLKLRRSEEFSDLPTSNTIFGDDFYHIHTNPGLSEQARRRIMHMEYNGVFNSEELVRGMASRINKILPSYKQLVGMSPLERLIRRFKDASPLERLMLRGFAATDDELENLRKYGIDGVLDQHALDGPDDERLKEIRPALFGVTHGTDDPFYGDPISTVSDFALGDAIKRASRGMPNKVPIEDFREKFSGIHPVVSVYRRDRLTLQGGLGSNTYIPKEQYTYLDTFLTVVVADMKFIN
tara:strand:+ start:20 stop:757 length:738 start_codon:yes stop_codon:yes gene_type:complete